MMCVHVDVNCMAVIIFLTKYDWYFILKTICRPFDPQYYEDEFEDEEMLDEEGRTRLKLKVPFLALLLPFFFYKIKPRHTHLTVELLKMIFYAYCFINKWIYLPFQNIFRKKIYSFFSVKMSFFCDFSHCYTFLLLFKS